MTARLGMLAFVVALLPGACSGAESSSGGEPACADTCVPVVAARCSNGPATQNECVQGCEYLRSRCKPRLDAVSACSGPNPRLACDAQGFVTVIGCEAEYERLNGCAAAQF